MPPTPLGPGRTPAPPTRASRLTDAPGASRTPTPKGGRTCARVCRHLAAGFGQAHPPAENTPGASAAPQRPQGPPTAGRKDCRPTPPGGWIYPQPLRPDPMQPARQLPPGHQRPGRRGLVPHPGTRCSRKASRPTRPRPPATSQQPGPAGHLNTGSPAPADLGKWTHKRLRARARTRARSAGTDGASPPSWTPQRPGRSGRNSVGRRQPAPPLDTGSRGPLPDTSTPTAGGARKKHQTR